MQKSLVPPLTLIAVLFLLSACQVTPEQAELQSRNASLESSLNEARSKLAATETRKQELQAQVQELQRVSSILAVEKSSRVEESSELRLQVRKFVQKQIDELKTFLVAGNLLDYVGSELVERSKIENEAMGIVDLAHPIPRAGSLTGVAGYFSAPVGLQLKVLRPIGEEMVVIWESDLLRVVDAGEARVQLPVAVGVEPGDVVAYIFPEAASVSFDEGTGNTRYTDDDLALGDTIKASSLSGEDEKRAYSLGVLAILE